MTSAERRLVLKVKHMLKRYIEVGSWYAVISFLQFLSYPLINHFTSFVVILLLYKLVSVMRKSHCSLVNSLTFFYENNFKPSSRPLFAMLHSKSHNYNLGPLSITIIRKSCHLHSVGIFIVYLYSIFLQCHLFIFPLPLLLLFIKKLLCVKSVNFFFYKKINPFSLHMKKLLRA